jgi:predicted CopG family antitoxin
MTETIEIDLDTLKELKNLKLRLDESLSSVIGRLAVYRYDWQPLTEEFIKKIEEIQHGKYTSFETIEELEDSLSDDDIDEEDEEEIDIYVRCPCEFIEEVNSLIAQPPIDLPDNMSLTDYLKSLPEVDDKLVIELNGDTAELLNGLKILDESLDSTVKRIAGYGIDEEGILSYGSIWEIQRLLREGKTIGPFESLEEFNEHLKYVPKEKIFI